MINRRNARPPSLPSSTLPRFKKPASFAVMEANGYELGWGVAGGLGWYDTHGTLVRECEDDELAYTYSQTVAHPRVDRGAMVQAVRFDQPGLYAH